MKKFVLSTLAGGLSGALLSSMAFGILDWTDSEVYWIGGKDGQVWLLLAVVTGFFFGGLFGAPIGWIVAFANASKWIGLAIGAGGGIIACAFISATTTPLDDFMRTIGGLYIPIGAAVGLVSGVVCDRQNPTSEPTTE